MMIFPEDKLILEPVGWLKILAKGMSVPAAPVLPLVMLMTVPVLVTSI